MVLHVLYFLPEEVNLFVELSLRGINISLKICVCKLVLIRLFKIQANTVSFLINLAKEILFFVRISSDADYHKQTASVFDRFRAEI